MYFWEIYKYIKRVLVFKYILYPIKKYNIQQKNNVESPRAYSGNINY